MFNYVRKIVKFLTSNSLLLALDGPLIVIFGDLLYEVEINPEILIAAFLTVFSVYNLNKVTDVVEDSINRPEITSRYSDYYVVSSMITMVAGLSIGAFIGYFAFSILLTPIIAGLFYSVKLSPSLPRLKAIVGAKSVLVAFSWSLFGCFLPICLQQVPSEKIFLVFTYVFIQVLVNTILFDVLDMKGDEVSGIRTLPIVLGKRRTKKLLILVNSALGIWLAYSVFRGLFLIYLQALLFGFVYAYVIIWGFLSNKCQRLCAELLVDGEWIPLVVLMKAFFR